MFKIEEIKNTVICGDNLDVAKNIPSNSISAILTDPPYGLGFMGKDWDTFKTEYIEKRKSWIGKNPNVSHSPSKIAGKYDLSRNPEFQQQFTIWAQAMLRITKPGGFLLCFGGTRTYHRLACAIEDAGWEIRDCMMWLYGSGFPKSHNISKAIDKAAGAKRGRIKFAQSNSWREKENRQDRQKTISDNNAIMPLAQLWQGYGTALKPAWEPIIVAMKPLDGTFAHNAEKHGVAGLNIDGGRISYQGEIPNMGGRKNAKMGGEGYGFKIEGRPDKPNTQGRWPANLLLDEEVAKGESWKRYFYCAKTSRRERNMGLDKSVIITIIKVWKENNITKEATLAEIFVGMDILQKKGISESGTRAKDDLEWNTILFGKNIMEKYQQDLESIIKTTINSTIKSQILNWLVTLFTKEYTVDVNLLEEDGGSPVENVKKCNLLKITTNEKMASLLGVKNVVLGMQLKISVKEKTNVHPTVKPLALMRYLCTLLKMPGSDQVILDPFLGSGTTGIACKELGIDFIGIEKEREYCEIAVKRIAAVDGQEITLHSGSPEKSLPVSKNGDTAKNSPHVSESRQRIIDAASAGLRRNQK